MSVLKILAAIANVTGWGSLAPADIDSTDLSSTFSSTTSDNFASHVVKLDTNKVLIAYSYKNLSGTGDTGVLAATIDETTKAVTFGTPVSFGTTYSNTVVQTSQHIFGAGIAVLSTTSFVIGWTDASGYGKCRAATVSGTTITLGTTINIQTTSNVTIRYVHAISLDTTRVIFVYRQWGTTNMQACLHTISGTTMTYRSVLTITSNVAYSIHLIKISSTRALVCLSNGSDAGYNSVSILSYSTNTINKGTTVQISTEAIADMSAIAYSASAGTIFYIRSGNLYHRRLSITGSTITTVSSEYQSQLPTATSTAFSLPIGSRFITLKIDGGLYDVAMCYYLGSSSTTLRPYMCVYSFNITTNTLRLFASVPMIESTTCYTQWGDTPGSLSLASMANEYSVAFGYFKDGTTYTMKLLTMTP